MLHLPKLPSTQICQTFALLPRCGEDYENITLKTKMTLFSWRYEFKSYYCFLTDLDYCDPNPCQHGGTCQQRHASHECICREEFKGKLCESKESLQIPSYDCPVIWIIQHQFIYTDWEIILVQFCLYIVLKYFWPNWNTLCAFFPIQSVCQFLHLHRETSVSC